MLYQEYSIENTHKRTDRKYEISLTDIRNGQKIEAELDLKGKLTTDTVGGLETQLERTE